MYSKAILKILLKNMRYLCIILNISDKESKLES
ncbi:hypothetical protein BJV85_000250 [Clostridium acetobutylicum]|nr:hypothetical protein [Clostridium acetobutylicum]NOW14375.1 hypothetical protein [Clostridium acetobutylicum]NRY58390.1 hypothetical protein [Clostridium acetobutylicum]NSA91404.1 hypothetical protein [Clostridium acetobutylicum]NYC92340.1 hypothetical protein [Clostridium acetobutylicum]